MVSAPSSRAARLGWVRIAARLFCGVVLGQSLHLQFAVVPHASRILADFAIASTASTLVLACTWLPLALAMVAFATSSRSQVRALRWSVGLGLAALLLNFAIVGVLLATQTHLIMEL